MTQPMLRGLRRLALGALLAGAVLWFALPVAASTLAWGAVAVAGLHGEGIEIAVVADPPLKLLLLEADAVHISARQGTWREIAFESLQASVTGLRLGGSRGVVDARLEGVELPAEEGARVRANTVLISGPLASADLRIQLSRDDVLAAVRKALPPDLAAFAGAISLVPPDGVRIATADGEVTARLSLGSDGSLNLTIDVPGRATLTATILRPGAALPLRLEGFSIDGASVELRGTLDGRGLGFQVMP